MNVGYKFDFDPFNQASPWLTRFSPSQPEVPLTRELGERMGPGFELQCEVILFFLSHLMPFCSIAEGTRWIVVLHGWVSMIWRHS